MGTPGSTEIEAVALSAKAEINAVRHQALTVHPLVHADLAQQVDGRLFQDTRANALFYILTRTQFDDDRLNSG